MKVGDYVRTNEGIRKIISEDEDCYELNRSLHYMYPEGHDLYKEDIDDDIVIKSSPNLIDLIEVGDYVNGCYVDEIIGANDSWDDRQHFHLLKFNSYFGNSDIKSIVTKEQFESMEYKVYQEVLDKLKELKEKK